MYGSRVGNTFPREQTWNGEDMTLAKPGPTPRCRILPKYQVVRSHTKAANIASCFVRYEVVNKLNVYIYSL